MKLILLCGVFLCVSAAPKDKKITLDDVERDNLTSERPPPPVKIQAKVSRPVQSPTNFGFVPHRSAASYTQAKPKQTYFQSSVKVQQPEKSVQYREQYVEPQKYIRPQYTKKQQKVAPQQQYTTEQQKYVPQQYEIPQQYSSEQLQHVPQEQQYHVQPQQQYAYVTQEQAQEYAAPQQQFAYIPQDQSQQYQLYENLQPITDNSVASAQQSGQQYYTPQYYYVQQYPAPSTAVQTVVDPKAGVQYVMYVPAPANQIPTENYEQTYASKEETVAPVPVTPRSQVKYATQYVAEEVQPAKTQYPKTPAFVPKREPKSLLDSYVPSYLQIKYLEQAQRKSKSS